MARGYREVLTWDFNCSNSEAIELLKEFFRTYGVDGYSVFINAQEFPHIRLYDVRKAELWDVVSDILMAETESAILRIRVNNEAKKYMIDLLTQPTKIKGAFKIENGYRVGLTTKEENAIPNGGYHFTSKRNTNELMEVAW